MVEETTSEEPTSEYTAKTADQTPESKTTPLAGFVEHQIKAAESTVKAFQALIPPDFRTHSREAGKEFVESFKVLIEGAAANLDQELNRMRSKGSDKAAPKGDSGSHTTGKTKVKVEVN